MLVRMDATSSKMVIGDHLKGKPDINSAQCNIDCTGPENNTCTDIGKKVWLFAKLQPGRAWKKINAT